MHPRGPVPGTASNTARSGSEGNAADACSQEAPISGRSQRQLPLQAERAETPTQSTGKVSTGTRAGGSQGPEMRAQLQLSHSLRGGPSLNGLPGLRVPAAEPAVK